LIELAQLHQLDEIFQLYRLCDIEMKKNGFTYWDDYPKKHQTKSDIINSSLYLLNQLDTLIAVITLDEEQFFPWFHVDWKYKEGTPLVIHRLAVHPRHQNKGFGKNMMDFAETWALENQYKNIRLDASSNNLGVHDFYTSIGYTVAGEVYLPVRDYPFTCYEKILS